MDWLSFVETSRQFLDGDREGSLLPLVEAVDVLYRIGPEKVPFGRGLEADWFTNCFFVCHRGLLSAAMITASGSPEDGEAITRRALEAAKTCLAIKVDQKNLDLWLSIELRAKRWRQRGEKQKPDPLTVKFKVHGEPLYEKLCAEIGALSDFAVHFTPDFFSRYEWEKKPGYENGTEYHFGLREGDIEKGFLRLCRHHVLIVRAFDRCQDGKMLYHPEVKQALDDVNELHELFCRTLSIVLGEHRAL